MMSDPEFWDEIDRQLKNIKAEAAEVRLFSQRDRDLISIEKVMPSLLKRSSMLQEINDGIGEGSIIFVETLSHISRMYLVMAVECLGINVPYDFISNFERLEVGTSVQIRTVQNAIQSKILSPEFFTAWAEIKHACGYMSALEADVKGQFKYYSSYVLKSRPKNIIQEHIYAYWMNPRWESKNKTKDERGDLHDYLANRIHHHIQNLSDNDPYHKILSSMITVENQDVFPAGRIYNMTESRIEELCRNNLIQKNELPDLGYDDA